MTPSPTTRSETSWRAKGGFPKRKRNSARPSACGQTASSAYNNIACVLRSQGKFAAAAPALRAQALAAYPKLAEDLDMWCHLIAASCAARAGCGQGGNARPSSTRRSGSVCGGRPSSWLRADLALCGTIPPERGRRTDPPARARETLCKYQQESLLRRPARRIRPGQAARGGAAALAAVVGRRSRTALTAPSFKWDDPRTLARSLPSSRSIRQAPGGPAVPRPGAGRLSEGPSSGQKQRGVCRRLCQPAAERRGGSGVRPLVALATGRFPHPLSPAAGTIPPDPILYLTFDEDTVQTLRDVVFVADLSGNGLHGTGQGVSYSPSGKVGGCLTFGGGSCACRGP